MTEAFREDTSNDQKNSDSQNSHSQSIRQQVFSLLDENSLLRAKMICQILRLPYKDYGGYANHLKSQWKHDYRNKQGSKCSNPDDVHAWRGFCYLPNGLVNRQAALGKGWIESKSRNRFLLWKDAKFGRMQWFETNRVNLYVRKPANLGKACQLFCYGFYATELITDMKILDPILKSIRFKSAHYVFRSNQRLPKMDIALFQESSGIFIKIGDRTHPHGVEVIVSYMDWAERLERLGERQVSLQEKQFQATVRLTEVLEGLSEPRKPNSAQDRSMVV